MFLNDDQKLEFMKGYSDICSQIKKVNVLIAGNTGAGKSTLINNLFGKKVCEIGKGRPCTQSFILYNENPYINIYDSKGMEKDMDIDGFINEMMSFIKEKNNNINPDDHIYIVLYCIDAVNIQESDIKLIKNVKDNGLNPIIIFTKADIRQDYEIENLKKTAKEYNINEKDIIFTSSSDSKFYQICSDEIKKGLSKLYQRISEITPEVQKHALEVAQNIDLELKEKKIKALRSQSYKIVTASAASAAAAGAIPIPGPDAVIITPIQLAMVGKIAAIYGLDVSECKEMVYPLLSQFIGQTVARQLIKFIPIAGSAISAGVAASMTGGLGYFCIDQFEKRAVASMRNEPLPPLIINPDIAKSFIAMFDKSDKK